MIDEILQLAISNEKRKEFLETHQRVTVAQICAIANFKPDVSIPFYRNKLNKKGLFFTRQLSVKYSTYYKRIIYEMFYRLSDDIEDEVPYLRKSDIFYQDYLKLPK